MHVDPSDPNTLVVNFKFQGAMDEIRVFTGTLNQPTGTIVVRKDAQPDDAQDFSFTGGGGLPDFTLDDDADATLANEQSFSVPAGSGYSVVEQPVSGWSLTSASCSDGSPLSNIAVSAGETVTCTFVNTEDCVPNAGNAIVESQPPANLHQDGLPAVAGRPSFESAACIFLFAEQQDVTTSQAINPAKPKTTNILDTTGSPEGVLIPAGSELDSHLLHADKPGVNPPSLTSLSGSWTFQEPIVGISIVRSGLVFGDPVSRFGLADISYEQDEPSRGVETKGQSANFDDVHVDPSDPNTLVVNFKFQGAMDEIRVFTGTLNQPTGTIVVRKDAQPDDAQDFSFTGGGGLPDFTLDDDADATLANEQSFSVPAGSGYSVVEQPVSGWSLTSASCSDGSPLSNIAVSAGETVTCTFVNTEDCVPNAGNAIVESQPPANLHQDGLPAVAGRPSFESAACIFLFAEQQDVTTSQAINPAKPKTTNILDTTGSPEGVLIPAGSELDSHLLHADKPGVNPPSLTSLSGSWTFQEPIVGISIVRSGLVFGDPVSRFGLADISYEQDEPSRGVETKGQSANFDDVHVDPSDPNTLVVNFKFQGAMDEIRVFTGTLNQPTGTIVVRKDAQPDDAQDFSFTGGGGLPDFTLDDDADATLANEQSFSVPAGSGYSVVEQPVSGWSLTSASCSDGSPLSNIAVSAGETVTCTFVNSQSSLVSGLKFEDVNGDGMRQAPGEGGLGDWTVRAYRDDNGNGLLDAGEATLVAETQTAVGSGAYQLTLPPGDYVLCELAQATWEQTAPAPIDNECGDTLAGLADGGHALTLNAGQNLPGQDFGNRREVGQLVVIKHVINDNGGTAVAADFTLDSGGTDDTPDNFPGAEAPGTSVSMSAGSYNVTETGPSGYTASFSADCAGSIASGETKTCTVTNNDIPVDSQITPPTATCAQFKAGTAATLSQLNYSVRNGKIHQVTPSAFYYWVKVTAVAGSNTFTINQAITTGNFDSHFFNHSAGQVFTSGCAKRSSTLSTSAGVTTVTFTAASAGTYVIGIKYNAWTVKSFTAPSPTTVHYTFQLGALATSLKGLDLVKLP